MDYQLIEAKTKKILEMVNDDKELDGDDIMVILESAYINQLAGGIIVENPGNDEDSRHNQLVTILSDFVKCMVDRFLSDPQVIKIMDGDILEKIELFSERLSNITYDVMLAGGSPSRMNN